MSNLYRLAPISAGNNPIYWPTVDELLSESDDGADPDASFFPFAEVVKTLGGGKFGRGFPIARWKFDAVSAFGKYNLRQICPGPSAPVYIETITDLVDASGNFIWIQASAVMNWPDGVVDMQKDGTVLDLEFDFTEVLEI